MAETPFASPWKLWASTGRSGVSAPCVFASLLEGIRQGHQGASGGIRNRFSHASGAPWGHRGGIRWLQNLGFGHIRAGELGIFKILKGVARKSPATGF